MSFIELPGINDVKEPTLAPEGMYDLIIVRAQIRQKDGKSNILVALEFEDKSFDYADVLHNISLPAAEDDPEKRKTKLLFAKRFFHQFGVPFEGGIDLEALPGCRGRAKVKGDEYEGKQKNVLDLDTLPVE